MKRREIATCLAVASLLVGINPVGRLCAQGKEGLVMVTSAAAQTTSPLSRAEAKRMVMGQAPLWPNGTRVVVVMRPAGSKDRGELLQDLCGMSEAEYTRFQMQLSFIGRAPVVLREIDSAAATKSFLKSNPNAVGFLHADEVDSSVRIVLSLH
jgi:hypothetical protein